MVIERLVRGERKAQTAQSADKEYGVETDRLPLTSTGSGLRQPTTSFTDTQNFGNRIERSKASKNSQESKNYWRRKEALPCRTKPYGRIRCNALDDYKGGKRSSAALARCWTWRVKSGRSVRIEQMDEGGGARNVDDVSFAKQRTVCVGCFNSVCLRPMPAIEFGPNRTHCHQMPTNRRARKLANPNMAAANGSVSCRHSPRTSSI